MPPAVLDRKTGKPAATKAGQKKSESTTPVTIQSIEALTPEPESVPATEKPAPVDRTAMIAEAAYYRALERGFTPGWELDDWLEAERWFEALQGSAR